LGANIPDADATKLFTLTNTLKLLSNPELTLPTMLESDLQIEEAHEDRDTAPNRHVLD
jgi:hypothetical protein